MNKRQYKKQSARKLSSNKKTDDTAAIINEAIEATKPFRRQSISAKRKSTAKEYGLNDGIKDGESVEHAYKRLAKKADRRLRDLEALAHDKHFKGIKTFAYASAMHDIAHWSGEGAKRFDTAAPASKRDLMGKINDIVKFLNSPTSLKRTTVAIYKKRVEKLNKRYADEGLNMTWQEFADFCEDNTFERGLLVNINSDTLFIKYAKKKKEKSKLVKELLAAKSKHKRVSEKEVNAEIRKSILEDGKTDVADFLTSDMSVSPFTFD